MCFGQKSKYITSAKRKNKHVFARAGISRTQVECVTSGPPSQLNILIEDNLFKCFTVMYRNINKQRQILDHNLPKTFFL